MKDFKFTCEDDYNPYVEKERTYRVTGIMLESDDYKRLNPWMITEKTPIYPYAVASLIDDYLSDALKKLYKAIDSTIEKLLKEGKIPFDYVIKLEDNILKATVRYSENSNQIMVDKIDSYLRAKKEYLKDDCEDNLNRLMYAKSNLPTWEEVRKVINGS